MSGQHGHEHSFEPVLGLPEALPAGEHIVWQGAPDWRALAISAFHLRKLAIYFAALLALRGAIAVADGASAGGVLLSVAWMAPVALIGLALVATLAWLSARTTVYTLTNRRVVMRIGIVLTLTLNLPLKRIAGADTATGPRGTAEIALTLAGNDRIAWLQLWPHARPWRIGKPQPALRCVPEGALVAQRLAQTWSAATGHTAAPLDAPQPAVPAAQRPQVVGQVLATR